MIEIANDNGFVLRLKRGEKIIDSLNNWSSHHVGEGFWLSGLGAAEQIETGYYDLSRRAYDWTNREELCEILNLSGNLAWHEGRPVWHVHGTFAGRDTAAFGGHVREFIVGATCEIFLTRVSQMQREFDDETGLNLLNG